MKYYLALQPQNIEPLLIYVAFGEVSKAIHYHTSLWSVCSVLTVSTWNWHFLVNKRTILFILRVSFSFQGGSHIFLAKITILRSFTIKFPCHMYFFSTLAVAVWDVPDTDLDFFSRLPKVMVDEKLGFRISLSRWILLMSQSCHHPI